MTDYDFSTLNDKEFENISIDLISIDKEKRFERFKSGRDGGIDGRFYGNNGKQEIIQCKHYLKTGFNGLISSLKKKNDKGINEIHKVVKLNPEKYIFTTSLPLSSDNKKIIKDLFKPFIKNDNDIYGQEDLNDILSRNSKIEDKYYKLWISSTAVLNRMFNNAINGRSEALIEDIKGNAKFYVIINNHNEALKKINETNVIIIAGEPGIGKTTLAEHIALYYIEKDFEFYDIENSINEAENIFNREKKQIFYFDDFLGSNYLEAIESKKDSHIMRFIERVKKDKTKRFILTSRTNIFNQSILLSDTFSSQNIEKNEFIIKIDSLKDIDKARILYNHIWHSDLEEGYKNELYINERYKKIIKHKNFNPRIISFITNIDRIKKEKISPKNYWNYVGNKLKNPKDIWKNTFDTQSDEFIRSLIILVVLNGNKIEETELRSAYNKYNKLVGLKNPSHISKEFDSIIEEVIKYFLNRTQKYNNKIEYTLFNPSIADFILHRYCLDEDRLVLTYNSLNTLDSLNELYSLKVSNRIQNKIYIKVLSSLLPFYKDYQSNYLIRLYSMCMKVKNEIDLNRNNIIELIQNIIDENESIELIPEFKDLVLSLNKDELNIKSFNFFSDIIFYTHDEHEINCVIELFKYFDVNDENMEYELNECISEYIESELNNKVDNITEYDVEFEEDYDDDGPYHKVQYGQVEQFINDYYDDIIGNIDYFDKLSINEEDIKDSIDVVSIEDNLSSEYSPYDYYDDERDYSNGYNVDDINDLFER